MESVGVRPLYSWSAQEIIEIPKVLANLRASNLEGGFTRAFEGTLSKILKEKFSHLDVYWDFLAVHQCRSACVGFGSVFKLF
jgi:hypothetical protein